MVKPNWDIFKAKFSDNPQKNFEWLCYILFCIEFDKPKGIFRYINQTAIETSPIKVDKDIIGWQSKYYDNTLSTIKDELLRCIKNINKIYPDITKLIFYTNQEWGQGRKKTQGRYKGSNEPIAKLEIENKASKYGIEIIWRTSSYFESPFVTIDNEAIAKHFFLQDKNIFELILEKKRHTESILSQIHYEINFNGVTIKIERKNLINLLNDQLKDKRVVIISGEGGVGKTAFVKEYYASLDNIIPFYVFKASEFSINNIKEVFGGYSFYEFNALHKNEVNKIIVIDSAEKLTDIDNHDPFKELLSVLLKNNWKVVFTSRTGYLNELNSIFIDIYKITPSIYRIYNLTTLELEDIARNYNFQLPKDIKLFELIENPFYLNEYLKYYNKDNIIDYISFKESLWDKIIIKSKPKREQCFLSFALKRASKGQFFILKKENIDTLDEFVKEGILGYEISGYFITHDIYEEWALEKIIESNYLRKEKIEDFFDDIGHSLPMRRSFRNWVSEKLLLKDNTLASFINEVLKNSIIKTYWKDEILISVLLSDNSDRYLILIEKELSENNFNLLKRIVFLLRVACKEVDYGIINEIGVKKQNIYDLKYIFTKPRGHGWEYIIKFIYINLKNIGFGRIGFVKPLINDWTGKHKRGETTRYSSLIALKCYQDIIERSDYFTSDDDKVKLFQTILNGSYEIKSELTEIYKDVISNKWKNHNNPYYDLSKMILKDIESIYFWHVFPDYTLKLAELFWFRIPTKEREYEFHSFGSELYFGLEKYNIDYYPASAFQTPIFWLLQISFEHTIDFIIRFTNKSIENFAKTEYGKQELIEIELYISRDKIIKQFISERIWKIYRGAVSSYILESMHMALEKYLLDISKDSNSEELEKILLSLLENTKSASITAIVSSIVMAYPDKTYNIAKILFQTKELFLFDNMRLYYEPQVLCPLSFGNVGYLLQSERLNSKKLDHRKSSLEFVFLNYTFIKNAFLDENTFGERQKELWQILDNYYDKIEDDSYQTEDDKTWRLCLARMDIRKMKPTTKKSEKGLEIHFNPEIDSKLKEYSEKSLEKSYEPIKHMSLGTWASYKNKNDDNSKQYEQYEKNPKSALDEVRVIVRNIKQRIIRSKSKKLSQESEKYIFLNKNIPSEVCSAILINYGNELSKRDIKFCRDIILDSALSILAENYRYQAFDGVESSFLALPFILKHYPNDRDSILLLLLITLLNNYPIGQYCKIYEYSLNAIQRSLWEVCPQDANAILFGYIYLKPKYDEYKEKIRVENISKHIYDFDFSNIANLFMENYETEIQDVIDNKIGKNKIEDIIKIAKLDTLTLALRLIKNENYSNEQFDVIKSLTSKILVILFDKNFDKYQNYEYKIEFIKKYSYLLLRSELNKLDKLLEPLLDNINSSETLADLLVEIIKLEDKINNYENYWKIWSALSDKIIEICNAKNTNWSTDKIIKSFLLARSDWNEDALEWHTLKMGNEIFFKKMTNSLGHHPVTIYSISKLLYGIGSMYLNEGIVWISDMIKDNRNLISDKFEINTIYYLEQIVKRYIYNNRELIRRNKSKKDEILVVLDLLIERGSVVGYILRENIL